MRVTSALGGPPVRRFIHLADLRTSTRVAHTRHSLLCTWQAAWWQSVWCQSESAGEFYAARVLYANMRRGGSDGCKVGRHTTRTAVVGVFVDFGISRVFPARVCLSGAVPDSRVCDM